MTIVQVIEHVTTAFEHPDEASAWIDQAILDLPEDHPAMEHHVDAHELASNDEDPTPKLEQAVAWFRNELEPVDVHAVVPLEPEHWAVAKL